MERYMDRNEIVDMNSRAWTAFFLKEINSIILQPHSNHQKNSLFISIYFINLIITRLVIRRILKSDAYQYC